jgi:hypothetical protein
LEFKSYQKLGNHGKPKAGLDGAWLDDKKPDDDDPHG